MSASSPNAILVIDPDPSIRALLLALLRRQGYLAEAAGNADDALRLHRTRHHAVVVVEPRIAAGDSLLHALETDGAPSRNLIVVTTPEDPKERYAEHPGVHAVLFKPFFLEDLTTAVASCCKEG